MAHTERDYDENGKLVLKTMRDEEDKSKRANNLAKFSRKVWNNIINASNNFVPEKEEDDWWITRAAKDVWNFGVSLVWDIVWLWVSAIWSAPKALDDTIASFYYDNVNIWWDDMKDEANKTIKQNNDYIKQETWKDPTKLEQATNRVWTWSDVIQKHSEEWDISAEWLDQALNNPLIWWLTSKLLKRWWKFVRWVTHVDDAARDVRVGSNILDDAVKTAIKWWDDVDDLVKTKAFWGWKPTLPSRFADEATDTSKIFSKTDDVLNAWSKVIDDVAEETAKKSWLLSKIKTIAKDTWSKVVNKTVDAITHPWQTIKSTAKRVWEWTPKFLFWPLYDIYQVWKAWVKTAKTAFKSKWIGKAVIAWVWETVASTIDNVADFFWKPLSYRTPKIWEAQTADMFIWTIADSTTSAYRETQFEDAYWYPLSTALAEWYNEEKLKEYYDNNNVPEDKRLTREELENINEHISENVVSDITNNWFKALEMTDLFSRPFRFANAAMETELIQNPRWETIWIKTTSWWTEIDFDNQIIKDKDWNEYTTEEEQIKFIETLSDEERQELSDIINEAYSEEEEIETEWEWAWWWDDQEDTTSPIMKQFEEWSTKWWLTPEMAEAIISGKNTKRNPTEISNHINETIKAEAKKYMWLYTKEQLEKDPQLQREVYNDVNAVINLITWTIDVLNEVDEKDYRDDAYYFRDAMSKSYENLSESDKALIDANPYQKAIDYNNNLESWAEWAMMRAGTKLYRWAEAIVDIFKSDKRELAFDLWLNWFWSTLVNPETRDFWVWLNDVTSSVEVNAPYLLNMWLLNKLNDRWVEKLTEKWLTNIIRKNPKLNTKWWNAMKAALVEASSEPLENLLDHVAMVDSADTWDDYVPWLIIGMFQGALAWYAGSTDTYTSFKDYVADPRNREDVLRRIWLNLNNIEDPQKRAAALEFTSQLFDNVVDLMSYVVWKTDNWVETLMQWYAIVQIESMLSEYTNGVISQWIDEINSVKKWDAETIQYYFWNQNDPTWQTNFNNYNLKKDFNFWTQFLAALKESNKEKFDQMHKVATAYVVNSFDTRWMTLEEWINYMAPKVYESTWGKVLTPIFNKKIVDKEVTEWMTWDPKSDIITIYADTWKPAIMIWDITWINPSNKLVYWEYTVKNKWTRQTKKKTGYKPKVTYVDNDWNTKTVSMMEYIRDAVINNPKSWLTADQRSFIARMLFWTSVSWLNSYFDDEWALTRLWVDFFEQVMPMFSDPRNKQDFYRKLTEIQTLKEAAADKSERDALNEVWANENTFDAITINWQSFKNWDDITWIDDQTELPIKRDWKNITIWELKALWEITFTEWWQTTTIWIFNNKISLFQEQAQINVLTQEEIVAQEQAEKERFESLSSDDQIKEIDKEIASLKEELWDLSWSDAYWTAKEMEKVRNQIKALENKKEEIANNPHPAKEQAQATQTQEQAPVYTADAWWMWKVTAKENTSKNRNRDVDLPVSVEAKDHPELKWFVDAVVLVNKWNDVKSMIPYMKQAEATVPIPIDDPSIWTFTASDIDLTISSNKLNKNTDNCQDNLQKIQVIKNWEAKTYSVVWLEDRKINSDIAWWTSGKSRDQYFKSFVLVDFENEEVNIERSNVIRPSKVQKEKRNQKRAFYKNNWVANVTDKEWKDIWENRVILITWKEWDSWEIEWKLNTTLQLDRLSPNDINRAFKNKRVFMNDSKESDLAHSEWWVWNKKVKYDARNIYTTSDIVFNDENTNIIIKWIDIKIWQRSYKKPFSLLWQKAKQETIQDRFNTLWKKWQTIREDWSTIEEQKPADKVVTNEQLTEVVNEMESVTEEEQPFPEEQTVKDATEVWKEVVDIINTQNDNVEMVIEEAKDTPAKPTESIAETMVKNQNLKEEKPTATVQNESTEITTAEKTTLKWVTAENIPSPTELVKEQSTPNEDIAKNLLSTLDTVNQLVDDCEKLWIVLESLDSQQLWLIITAYRQWLWIDYVINQFADNILSSSVDKKLVELFIKRWILRDNQTYDWLSLQQMINYTALVKEQVKQNLYKMIDPNELNWKQWYMFIDWIVNYYIENYFHYNPKQVSWAFRARVRWIIKEKLFNEDIHIVEPDNNALNVDLESETLLELEQIDPEVRKMFARDAYNKKIISASTFNYLMWNNPYIVNVNNWVYNPWIIASWILTAVNEIPEFWNIASKTADRNKVLLMINTYNYFSKEKKWTYKWLISYLREQNKKTRYGKKSKDEMEQMIKILEDDMNISTNPIHSEDVITILESDAPTFSESPYQQFIKDKKDNPDAIVQALAILEKEDKDSFKQVVKNAPKNIKRRLASQFNYENSLNHTKNLAYWLVASLLTNNSQVQQNLKDEENNIDMNKVSEDAKYILRNFDRRALISPIVTQQLFKELWIRNLNLTKWTVILTDNGKNTLWKWMKNFKNVKSYDLFPVNSLKDLTLDVNVIVPYWVSVPKEMQGRFNIIRMNKAWYYNGSLVVKTYEWEGYDLSERVYNLFWLSWLWISYWDYKFDKSAKAAIASNIDNNSLYWNIFKYNVLPNLWDQFQDMSQDKFEKMLDPKKFKKVKKTTLYNAFLAKDLDSLIEASVSVINTVTNNKLKLISNIWEWRKWLMINETVQQFTDFVATNISNPYQREQVLKMFSDYITAQIAIGDFDRWERFHEFCDRHDGAFMVLDELFRNRSVFKNDISSIFLNQNNWEEATTDTKVASYFSEAIKSKQVELDWYQAEYDSIKDKDDDRSMLRKNELESKINKAQKEIDNMRKSEKDRNIDEEDLDDVDVTLATEEYIDLLNTQQIDVEQANNSSVVTSEFETSWAYEDKAIKILAAIFEDFIEPNAISQSESTEEDLNNPKVVSKELLWVITWKETFKSMAKPLTEWVVQTMESNTEYSTNRRADVWSKDLVVLQQMIMTLKNTSPEALQSLLDKMIVTQEDMWYWVQWQWTSYDRNEKLKRLKKEIFDDPIKFYNIMDELLSDDNMWVDVYYNVEFEKTTKYKWIQIKWLLNSIAQEYYKNKPNQTSNKKTSQLHEEYDKYFNIKDENWNTLQPSDEQVRAFAELKNKYDNRTKWWTLPIPGIAWTWKTTLITALFNYIVNEWWAKQETTMINYWKQKAVIKNFHSEQSEKLYQASVKWKDVYMRITNADWSYSTIKFNWKNLLRQNKLEELYNSYDDAKKAEFMKRLSDKFWWMWNEQWLLAMMEIWEWNKSDYSRFTWMISEFELRDWAIPEWAEFIDNVPWNQWYLDPRKWQHFQTTTENWEVVPVERIVNLADGLNNVSFAVRMHSTVWSLKDVLWKKWWVGWLDIATIDSYLIQDDPTLINDVWYSTSYSVRSERLTEWRIIIIDETQNSYDNNLQALVNELSKNNVIVFLWDYHQMSKWDFLSRQKSKLYMTETHRWTEDINIMNEISSFVQRALIRSNAIWLYMSDSDDFVQYEQKDIKWLINKDIKKTLMVCSKNDDRQAMNDLYIQELWWMDKIIKSWTTLQTMIVDIESNKSSERNRKSEIPDEWLNMKWFIPSKMVDSNENPVYYYRKNKDWSMDVFFPSTRETDMSNDTIKRVVDSMHKWNSKKWWYWVIWKDKNKHNIYWDDLRIYVPAFAITTEKESGKTVDNIILHEDITNTEYDYLSEQNVKQYYDAFTRWSKKVYIPKNSSRLIWITREQAHNLRDGKWLTSATINAQDTWIERDTVNIPSINNGARNWSYIVDYMWYFLDMFESLWVPWIDEAKATLADLSNAMTMIYLQTWETSTDRELNEKSKVRIDTNVRYQDSIKLQIAQIWDSLYSKVRKTDLYNKITDQENPDKLLNRLFTINSTIYWQTIKTPVIERKRWNEKLLYWQKKYINRKVDNELLADVMMQQALIWDWSLLEWRLLKPVTKQDKSWKFYTTLQSVKVNWETKNRQWWISFTMNWLKWTIEFEQEKNEISTMFTEHELNLQNIVDKYEIDMWWKDLTTKNVFDQWDEKYNSEEENENLDEKYNEFEADIKAEQERFADVLSIYHWKLAEMIEDNDLWEVRDFILSNMEEDVYVDSWIQESSDAISDAINIIRENMDVDERSLMESLINLAWNIVAFNNWEVTAWEIEQEFNVMDALNEANDQFTCK